MIYDFKFPFTAPKDSPIAMGGNLEPQTLINAYKKGIFPWFNDGEPILWWSPDPRAILMPQDINIQKSMKKYLSLYEVKIDKNFENFINACLKYRALKGQTWLSDKIVNAYIKLFELEVAHSVEIYYEDELIGGLYGLMIGSMFCGESMLSLKPNASKVALIRLCQTLSKYDCFIDCQVMNEHLKFMGAKKISRNDFLSMLQLHITKKLPYDFRNLFTNKKD